MPRPRPRIGLTRRGAATALTGVGALVLALVALLALLPALLRPDAQARARDEAARIAASAATRLDRRVTVALERVASAGDEAALRDTFPAARRIRHVPPAGLTPAPRAEPPVGYALADQVTRCLRTGTASAEVHLPGSARAQLNLVAAAGDDGGAWLVTLPVSRLLDWASSDGVTAAVTIRHGDTVLAQRGRADGPSARAPVPGQSWSVAVQQPPPQLPLEIPGTWITLLGLAGLTTAGTGAYLRRRGEPAGMPTKVPAVETDITPAGPAPEPPKAHHPIRSPAPSTPPGIEVSEAEADTGTPPAPADTPAGVATATAGVDTGAAGETIPPGILRAYDIRGIVGETLTPEVVTRLGHAIAATAREAGNDTVVVGRDARHSSPELARALIAGLSTGGCHVVDVDTVPTPVLYFAVHHLGTGSGVMVTGSHNPPGYNGLKVMIGGETLAGDAIQDLGRRAADAPATGAPGEVERRQITEDYIDQVGADITLYRPLRVVVDCGNGVTAALAPELYRALGCEVTPLFCEIDGDFPNHHPDPAVPENLATLQQRVVDDGADIGLAFDGDGDRLGVVDSEGAIIWPDRQMMLFARDILARLPGSDIVFDVKCSRHLAELISANAGVPVMSRSGHSPIKQRRAETNAPLAGEMSGHIVLADRWYPFDDALYAGARLLELLSFEAGQSSAALFAGLPGAGGGAELRVPVAEGEAEAVMARLLANTHTVPEAARVTTIDGLRIDFADGWGLVRASNTEPALTLRFEGDDEAALERIREHFRGLLAAAAPALSPPF
ncbi:phosphomannomutase/phosphoglucomutase [Arhodomonas aquaeolei]|uniref:phosphomannomutase/phosphoglucomutase n=1 Tax=Arhodomonas aquaeolei TaxID=2369 RepID=UPI0003738EBE|nr:phosphomannomutase/phosphoglucomutase [Arhodomonas aquaeolei]